MTLANKLTFCRILLAVPFILLLLFEGQIFLWGALAVFSAAMLTDYLDGKIARSRDEVSDIGKFMDPLADKVFVSSALVIFVGMPDAHLPAWPVAVILGREFIVSGFRSLAASKGRVIPADLSGKAKTVLQMAAVFVSLLVLAMGWDTAVIYYLVTVAAVMTLYSGWKYIRDNRDILHDDSIQEDR